MRNRARLAAQAWCLLVCLAGCSNAGDSQPEPGGSATVPLRVMSFNIEWGGTHISFANVVAAIRLADADIVGIQEAEGNLQRLAAELGWHYDLRNYVISKFPLLDPPGADGKYVYVEVAPGKIVAMANVHLPADPSGTEQVRDGATPAQVLATENRTRLPWIKPYLAVLPPLVQRGIPVFLSGDFNAPAHTDWTEEMVGRRPFLPYPLDWPVSLAVAGAGLHDAWRTVYPDPVSHPGLTWWAARPPLELYAPGANDPQDRIDFLWFAGPATILSAALVGEAGRDDVAISVTPWPSDHRAIVASFAVTPAAMPELVSTSRRIYQLGEAVEVIYHSAQKSPANIKIVSLDDQRRLVAQQQTGSEGRFQVAAPDFVVGHYQISMQRAAGKTPLAKDFWVIDPAGRPSVEVIGNRFRVGQPIAFQWDNAPGNRNDYVAVYPAANQASYGGELAWTYVNALPRGSLILNQVTAAWGWPLQPGAYILRLLQDDGYQQLAESAPFHVE